MITLWVIAAWHRLKVVDEAIVGSDALGPYLQAQALRFGHLPHPPNPESGDALWLLSLPIVSAATSLKSLFEIRFIVGGVIAPIAFAAAWHWTSPKKSAAVRWSAAITAGLLVAFDPGLLDTLVSGARSYWAPELIGVFTLSLALAIRGHPLAPATAAISWVLAAGHHPLASGMALGALPLAGTLHRAHGGRRLKQAAIIGIVVALPRLWRILNLAFCGEGIGACLSQVAQSNRNPGEAWSRMLGRAIHDRWLVDMGVGAWIILGGLGAILLCRDQRRVGHLALFGGLGILVIGLSQGYVRSYHLRITAVPIAVAAAMGLARLWPIAPIAAAAFVFKTAPLLPVGPDVGAVDRHDQLAGMLAAGPLWVDRVWWEGPVRLDPSAVVLSAWLSGKEAFQLGPDTPMMLLISGPDSAEDFPGQHPGWSTMNFDNRDRARAWLNTQNRLPHQVGGAYDWATISDPETRLEDARW